MIYPVIIDGLGETRMDSLKNRSTCVIFFAKVVYSNRNICEFSDGSKFKL